MDWRLIAATLVTAFCVPHTESLAQYIWLDEKGTKQYSDLPPPAEIPRARILKQNVITANPAVSSSAKTTAEIGTHSKESNSAMTTAERNAEFHKRKTEQAEKEKKLIEETRAAEEKKKHCEHARDYYKTLASGERIVRTDNHGERSFLTDDQRNQDLRDVKRALETCR